MLIGAILTLSLFIILGGVSTWNLQKRSEGHDCFAIVVAVIGMGIAISLIVNLA